MFFCFYSQLHFVAFVGDSFVATPHISADMADYNYGGSEEENAELKKLEAELVCCDNTGNMCGS